MMDNSIQARKSIVPEWHEDDLANTPEDLATQIIMGSRGNNNEMQEGNLVNAHAMNM
jgi:hypothetical protein